jgi:hypothetical protein
MKPTVSDRITRVPLREVDRPQGRVEGRKQHVGFEHLRPRHALNSVDLPALV